METLFTIAIVLLSLIETYYLWNILTIVRIKIIVYKIRNKGKKDTKKLLGGLPKLNIKTNTIFFKGKEYTIEDFNEFVANKIKEQRRKENEEEKL